MVHLTGTLKPQIQVVEVVVGGCVLTSRFQGVCNTTSCPESLGKTFDATKRGRAVTKIGDVLVGTLPPTPVQPTRTTSHLSTNTPNPPSKLQEAREATQDDSTFSRPIPLETFQARRHSRGHRGFQEWQHRSPVQHGVLSHRRSDWPPKGDQRHR